MVVTYHQVKFWRIFYTTATAVTALRLQDRIWGYRNNKPWHAYIMVYYDHEIVIIDPDYEVSN